MTEQQAKEVIFKVASKLRDEAYATHILELVEESSDFDEAIEIMDNAWQTQQEAGELDEDGNEIEDEDWDANGD